MKLEWSDAALADIDRFVEFLNREHPSLARVVAGEIVGKVQVLSEHPMLGRPIAGREEYLQTQSRPVAMGSWLKAGTTPMALKQRGRVGRVRRLTAAEGSSTVGLADPPSDINGI